MPIFIDNLSFTIPYSGPSVSGGRLLELDMEGNPKWEFEKGMHVEGSHTAKVLVKTIQDQNSRLFVGCSQRLHISGNPLKYFQGHNVWGTADLKSLVYDITKEVMMLLGHNCLLANKVLHSDMSDVLLRRVDATAMYELPSLTDVRSWLLSAIQHASGKNQKTTSKGTTLYLGQFSKKFTFMAYGKYDELQQPKHKLPDTFTDEQKEYINKWAYNKIRFECKFRYPYLRDTLLADASKWFIDTPSILFYNVIKNKLILSGDFDMCPEQICELPKKYQRIYHQWYGGSSIVESYSQATAYRYRKFFINQFGIDIFKQRPNPQSNVVPLIRVLEAKPASIPDEAYSMGLVYRPNSGRS